MTVPNHCRSTLSLVLVVTAALLTPGAPLAASSNPPSEDASHTAPALLLIYDMAGLSNVTGIGRVDCSTGAEYDTGVAGIERDVIAVIDGLFAGGTATVDVWDAHGSGDCDPDPDLPAARLDSRARSAQSHMVMTTFRSIPCGRGGAGGTSPAAIRSVQSLESPLAALSLVLPMSANGTAPAGRIPGFSRQLEGRSP